MFSRQNGQESRSEATSIYQLLVGLWQSHVIVYVCGILIKSEAKRLKYAQLPPSNIANNTAHT
jgi:hypothetical protein